MWRRLVLTCLSIGLTTSVLGQDNQHQVTDVDYGVALYHFYQGDYFRALTQLQVAEQRGGIEHNGVSPKMLEAGMSLSFGLNKQSQALFEQLLDDPQQRSTLTPQAIDQAWFYLAKIHYQGLRTEQAEHALAQVGDALPEVLNNEFAYLHTQVLLSQGQALVESDEGIRLSAQFSAWREQIRADSMLRAYADFNLATVLSAVGAHEPASVILLQLANQDNAALQDDVDFFDSMFSDEDQRQTFADVERAGFRDRVYLALGYSYIAQAREREAMEAFRQVRLDQLDTDAALLGYGWAALNDKKYLTAVQAWKTLAGDSGHTPYGLEALIAIPFGYEKLQADALALSSLRVAESRYVQELASIDEMLGEISQQGYFTRFLAQGKWADSRSVFAHVHDEVAPQQPGLIAAVASEDFQYELQQLRDLALIREQLAAYQKQLETHQLMLNVREFARAERLAMLEQVEIGEQLPKLRLRQQALVQGYEQAVASEDVAYFADAQQLVLLQDLAQAQQRLDKLEAGGKDVSHQRARVQRLQGVLHWQLSNQFVAKAWQTQQALKDLDAQVQDAQVQQDGLRDAIAHSPDFVQLQTRISRADAKVNQRQVEVDALYQQTEARLALRLTGELQQQRAQVQNYLTQARLAIVRLDDDAYQRDRLKASAYQQQTREQQAQEGGQP